MSRAAILPLPGDPFLFRYWLHFYDNVWGKEIDKLYVVLNSPIEKEAVEYIFDLCQKRKITFIYEDQQIEHGDAINTALQFVTEDYVMLIEDDGYIFKPGLVESIFKVLEEDRFDIVGSARGSCSQEIYDRAAELWGLDYSGYGDTGPNFWPCYFFCKTDLLKQTTRRFGARAWFKGETIEPLSYVVEAPVVTSDTFVNTSLELQAKTPQDRIWRIRQYHASPDDWENYEQAKDLFNGQSWWTHVGSLSSGISGVLRDRNNRPLSRRRVDPPEEVTTLPVHVRTEQERKEWERRVAFWDKFANFIPEEEVTKYNLGDLLFYYKEAIARLIDSYKLRRKYINRLQKAYATLGL